MFATYATLSGAERVEVRADGSAAPTKPQLHAARHSIREATQGYMQSQWASPTSCDDVNDQCSFWASTGECVSNPDYMQVECARACETCHLRDPKVRCKRFEGQPASMQPGELNSRLAAAAELPTATVHSADPWILTFDDFLSVEEIEGMTAQYDGLKFEQSTNLGAANTLGRYARPSGTEPCAAVSVDLYVHRYDKSIDTTRTSRNAWCIHECMEHPLVRTVTHRIGNLTGVGVAQHSTAQHSTA